VTGTAPLLAAIAAALTIVGAADLAPARRGKPRGRRRDGAAPIRLLAAVGAHARARLNLDPPRDLHARIAAAGFPGGLGAREVTAAKLAAAAGGAFAGATLGAVAPGRLGIALAAAGPVAGFLAPDRWLARRARRRAEHALRELPALLDLLRVTVEAGLPPSAALAEVGRRARGPLADEWRRVGAETRLGVPLATSLAGTTERLPLPEVEQLVAALDRAARHGAPLAATLAVQAEGARLARRRRIQEEAARAGPKIQLVVALLLVPSVLLLVAAALAAALLDGGGGLAVAGLTSAVLPHTPGWG
jgi:tight adherence protein C